MGLGGSHSGFVRDFDLERILYSIYKQGSLYMAHTYTMSSADGHGI